MKVLLVEPKFRRLTKKIKNYIYNETQEKISDDSLWYPPLGLMKLSTFHKMRGDQVYFKCGLSENVINSNIRWDRIYISTLFTYSWKEVINTINASLKAVNGKNDKIFVGGIMSTLMAEELFEQTNIYPVKGILNTPSQILLDGETSIDCLPPDYALFSDMERNPYAINETYYAYTSRGCINKCGWCGVPKIEPKYVPYIDIKDSLRQLRKKYGDKPVLKLMDNNILASNQLSKIVDDLLELGYGKGSFASQKKERIIDFNQGLDASFFSDDKLRILSALNIKPMRIAFDSIKEKETYKRALAIAKSYGFYHFSNYILYNWNDSPKDLYDRLVINIKINETWRKKTKRGDILPKVYSYPMRYAPIHGNGLKENRFRDLITEKKAHNRNNVAMKKASWNLRFMRNIEVMKGAASGAISSTPSLAWRTIGSSYDEFMSNLYMPTEFLRNRNKYEKKVYDEEPKRDAGSGEIEEFRNFIYKLMCSDDERFVFFHDAVAPNRREKIRDAINVCQDREVRKWLKYYLL